MIYSGVIQARSTFTMWPNYPGAFVGTIILKSRKYDKKIHRRKPTILKLSICSFHVVAFAENLNKMYCFFFPDALADLLFYSYLNDRWRYVTGVRQETWAQAFGA